MTDFEIVRAVRRGEFIPAESPDDYIARVKAEMAPLTEADVAHDAQGDIEPTKEDAREFANGMKKAILGEMKTGKV